MEIEVLQVGYLQTNCYLLYPQKGKAIVVDPGGGFARIDRCLRFRGIDEISVLLTHCHFDHILALSELQQHYKTIVFIHIEDKDGLNNDYNLAEKMGLENLPYIESNVVIDKDIEFEIYSAKVKAIHTPGHTKGSVCYIIGDIIFSGDTLFYKSYGRTDFIGGNLDDMKKSLEKLFSLEKNYQVFPGHGTSTNLEFERIYNRIN